MRSLAPGTPLILVLGMPSGMVLVRGSMASPSCDTLWFCRHFEGDTCCQTEEEVEVDANAFCSFPPDYANPAKDPSATACVMTTPEDCWAPDVPARADADVTIHRWAHTPGFGLPDPRGTS